MPLRCVGLLLMLTVLPAAGSAPNQNSDVSNRWKTADRNITRLPVSAFPDLPADVRNELRRRGCTVPQVPGEKKPHNVIRGEFIQRGEVDWAILCSVHRASTLLVFRPGAASKCLALASGADIANLQGAGEEKIAYSRAITAVGRAYIDEHYRAYLGTKPPVPIDHQGIDDAFVGKASVVHYFYRGKWLELQGAD